MCVCVRVCACVRPSVRCELLFSSKHTLTGAQTESSRVCWCQVTDISDVCVSPAAPLEPRSRVSLQEERM